MSLKSNERGLLRAIGQAVIPSIKDDTVQVFSPSLGIYRFKDSEYQDRWKHRKSVGKEEREEEILCAENKTATSMGYKVR